MSKVSCALLVLLVACWAGCRGSSPSRVANENVNGSANSGGEKVQLKVTSAAFAEGQSIPAQYTCDGRNVSPPLAWDGVPSNAKTLALVADDPDAPRGTWVHWVLFNLPAGEKALAEALPATETLASGAKQGKNDFGNAGYGGPCPPSGAHRYFFKLYALDTRLDLASGATKDQLLKAMQGHVVAEGELMGRYQRAKR
ncbi:MAG: YbhB/YbcL family Raf kinase inhibitor-like protein [Acidobacteria bacterium]|nr:YbhB/YbcL family Raf kinase inhibitor-like protein [Acidobacteriota bacterium]